MQNTPDSPAVMSRRLAAIELRDNDVALFNNPNGDPGRKTQLRKAAIKELRTYVAELGATTPTNFFDAAMTVLIGDNAVATSIVHAAVSGDGLKTALRGLIRQTLAQIEVRLPTTRATSDLPANLNVSGCTLARFATDATRGDVRSAAAKERANPYFNKPDAHTLRPHTVTTYTEPIVRRRVGDVLNGETGA